MHKYFDNISKSIHFENYGDSVKKRLRPNDVATSRSSSAKKNILESCSFTSKQNNSYFNSTSSVKQNSLNFPLIPILRKSSKSSKGLSLVERYSSGLSSSSIYSESIEPDSTDLPLYTFTSLTDTISTNYTNPNSSWFGDQSSRSTTIKGNLSNVSLISVRSTSSSSLTESEHSRKKIKYKKPGVSNMSSNYNAKSADPVRNTYRIAEPHMNVQLGSVIYTKRVYKSDSLESITSIAARIAKYQQQLKKHESFCPLFRKEYEENFVIGDYITQMEKLLSNRNDKKLRTCIKKGSHLQKPLRIATPDRAKELVEKYFNSSKSIINNLNQY